MRLETMDLFEVQEDYSLAFCVSADFAMYAGIAAEFEKRFGVKEILQQKYPDFVNIWHKNHMGGCCIRVGRVLALVTKERYYHRETYAGLEQAVKDMEEMCMKEEITKVAMPMVGTGLGGLDWEVVSGILDTVEGVEILACRCPEDPVDECPNATTYAVYHGLHVKNPADKEKGEINGLQETGDGR